jgi:hypothetical protein
MLTLQAKTKPRQFQAQQDTAKASEDWKNSINPDKWSFGDSKEEKGLAAVTDYSFGSRIGSDGESDE